MDMGTMEKTDMARVITPIMTPPVCSVTQQQHCRNRGISGHTPRVCNHNFTIYIMDNKSVWI